MSCAHSHFRWPVPAAATHPAEECMSVVHKITKLHLNIHVGGTHSEIHTCRRWRRAYRRSAATRRARSKAAAPTAAPVPMPGRERLWQTAECRIRQRWQKRHRQQRRRTPNPERRLRVMAPKRWPSPAWHRRRSAAKAAAFGAWTVAENAAGSMADTTQPALRLVLTSCTTDMCSACFGCNGAQTNVGAFLCVRSL